MNAKEPRSDLLGALLVLTATARELRHDARQSLPTARLEHLQETVNALSPAKATGPLRCPEAYVQQWQQFLAGSCDRLEPVAIPYLCRQPKIATDARFQRYLDRVGVRLGARAARLGQILPRSLVGRVGHQFSRENRAAATRVL